MRENKKKMIMPNKTFANAILDKPYPGQTNKPRTEKKTTFRQEKQRLDKKNNNIFLFFFCCFYLFFLLLQKFWGIVQT